MTYFISWINFFSLGFCAHKKHLFTLEDKTEISSVYTGYGMPLIFLFSVKMVSIYCLLTLLGLCLHKCELKTSDFEALQLQILQKKFLSFLQFRKIDALQILIVQRSNFRRNYFGRSDRLKFRDNLVFANFRRVRKALFGNF